MSRTEMKKSPDDIGRPAASLFPPRTKRWRGRVESVVCVNDVAYAVDSIGNRLVKFDEQSGKIVVLDSKSLLRPRGLCATRDNRALLVCDTGHHRIKMYSLHSTKKNVEVDLSCLHVAGSGRGGSCDGPADIATFDSPVSVCQLSDAEGTIVVYDGAESVPGKGSVRCIRLARNARHLEVSTLQCRPFEKQEDESDEEGGDKRSFASIFRYPPRLCADDRGRFFLSDAHSVRIVYRERPSSKVWIGKKIAGSSPTHASFRSPRGMCLTRRGLFVCDPLSRSIRLVHGHDPVPYIFERIDTARRFDRANQVPYDICATSGGHDFYVADALSVQKIRIGGERDAMIGAEVSFADAESVFMNMSDVSSSADDGALCTFLEERGLSKTEADLVVACMDRKEDGGLVHCLRTMGLLERTRT